MNIADLFINIGVTGADKTTAALGQVKNTITDAVSSAIEAKAALFGVLYALEKLIQTAGSRGTELSNLGMFLGTSTKELQKFEYAAKRAGSSSEEMDQVLLKTKKMLTDIALNKGVPDFFPQFANTLKKNGMEISKTDIKKFAAQPDAFINLYQQYAKFEKDPTLRRAVLEGLGLSPTFIATLEKQAYTRDKLNKAHLLSDKDVKDLDKARESWTEVTDTMTVSSEKLVAKWGPKVAADMVKLLPAIEKLADAFARLVVSTNGLSVVGKVFEGWSIIFEGWVKTLTFVNELLLDLGKPGNFDKAARAALGWALGDTDIHGNAKQYDKFGHPTGAEESDEVKKKAEEGQKKQLLNNTKTWKENNPEKVDNLLKIIKGESGKPGEPGKILPTPEKAATPSPPPVAPNGKTQAQNINVEQNLNFQHPGTNAQQVAYDVHKATRDTLRQLHAQAGGV